MLVRVSSFFFHTKTLLSLLPHWLPPLFLLFSLSYCSSALHHPSPSRRCIHRCSLISVAIAISTDFRFAVEQLVYGYHNCSKKNCNPGTLNFRRSSPLHGILVISTPGSRVAVTRNYPKNAESYFFSKIHRSEINRKLKMKQTLLLLWTTPYSPSPLLNPKIQNYPKPISATLESAIPVTGELTAKERRQLRNSRRESKSGTNWREEVEDKLLVKPKKRYANWKEELNLDNLAKLGPQWWGVRVSRVNGQETAERLARFLIRNHPNVEFKVYAPAVHIRKKLKNGTISVKPKPLFPGCVFLRCVLNKETHDIVRECPGIGGFIGSKVGNTKRQINLPKAVSTNDIEAIFQQAKEEQEQADQSFKEEQESEVITKKEETEIDPIASVLNSILDLKPKKKTRKAKGTIASVPVTGADDKVLVPGSSVRVVSGSFSDFQGNLKKLDVINGMASVGFMLFGKESIVELEVKQLVAET